MSKRSIVEDLAALVVPDPDPTSIEPPEMRDEVLPDLYEQVLADRRAFVADLEARWADAGEDFDPVLDEIARARADMDVAETRLRLLVAFGRELVRPRPYRLEDLADAAGMSPSGIRTAYGPAELARVRQLLGLATPADASAN